MIDVRDFGAKGDGIAKDTAALQRALDCGGTVHVPSGRYLTGTLYIGSNTSLLMEDGATLVGSPDAEDYNAADFCPQNRASTVEKASGRHLIVALNARHVSIRGGCIDGNRAAFFNPSTTTRDEFTGWRPSQMLFLCETDDVRIEGVTLLNSPYWACFLHGCDNVFIDRVRILEEDRHTWNGDGIDIDCCKNVVVSNCNIESSDDSLTVRASGCDRLLRHDGTSENICVSNCVLSSRQAAIRIGVGTGTIRNCTFSNLAIHGTSYGICINSCYAPKIFPTAVKGVTIENLMFSDVVMDVHIPILISSTWQEDALEHSGNVVHGLTMRGIRAKAMNPIYMQGNPDFNHHDICIEDSVFEISGNECGEKCVLPLPKWMRRPCGIFLNNMKDVTLKNVRLKWNAQGPDYKRAMVAQNSPGLRLLDCVIDEPI
ncbi:MAG: right-handed parallel beta-helix repeat-containing protein [Victivallales bacterium]|nr:right-handed parallel beta-helix repeat-containing protein [Victivallales bacterium]